MREEKKGRGASKINNQEKVSTLSAVVTKYSIFIALAILVAFFCWTAPAFFSGEHLINILRAIAVTTIIGIGLTIALSAEAIDLSVANVAGFVGAISAGLMVYHEAPLWVALLLPICVGGLLGAFVAFLAIKMNIDDLLASLAVLFVAQGLELTYTNGLVIYSKMLQTVPGKGYIAAPGVIHESYIYLGQGFLGPIPVPIIIMAMILLITHFYLNNTKYGRFFYATGDNREATRLAGIQINRYRFLAHFLAGIYSAIGGVILTARLASAQTLAAGGLLLDVMGAAFIGVAVFAQGKPNILGTFVGAVLMGVMVNGLTMLHVPYTTQDVFKGLALIGALCVSQLSVAKS